MSTAPVILDGSPLSIAQVAAVARNAAPVEISPDALESMQASASVVEGVAAGNEAVYGINTGFGSLSKERIDPESNRSLQLNLVRSHAAGVGDPLPPDLARAM
ncbi:MAG: aromatic amino acid lyase, partial [Phycisphaerales bacterium]|nr:aromatic amino acid lyase [Phycisphaerales bacterium]